jgi:hypothetical protein
VLLRSGERFRGAAGAESKSQSEPVEKGQKEKAIKTNENGSATDDMEQTGLRGAGAFNLLEFEFIRPDDDGPPDELIEQDDDGDHRGNAPENRARVAMAGRGLQERAQAGEAEVVRAKHEHFASHQEKPAAGDGHHGIPDETDGGKRKVELGEALPAAEAIDDRGLMQFARNGFQRRIETESNIPDLPGEDEQDAAEFYAEFAVGKDGDHSEHHAGKKTQHRDGLENVQERNHDDFGAARACGNVTISESEQ